MLELILSMSGVSVPIVLPDNLGPGPQTLLMGNAVDGYFGVTTQAELGITPVALMNAHKPSGGKTGYNSDWHKFVLDGRIIYLAQLTAWFNVTWPVMNTAGLVTGREITVGVDRFIHRIISGDTNNPTAIPPGAVRPYGQLKNLDNSEYGRTMFHITATSAGGTGRYAQLTKAQMQWSASDSNGNVAMIKERAANSTTQFRCMGGFNGTGFVYQAAANAADWMGYRPMLELKQS